jgi:hypothetical protein
LAQEFFMKLLFVLLLGSVLSSLTMAQTAAVKHRLPDIEVLDVTWRHTPPERNNIDLQSYLGRAPLQFPDRSPNSVANLEVQPLYRSTDIKKWSGWLCEFTVRNTGAKAVRKIVWHYAFTDPVTGQTVGYRQYKAKVNIKPGTTAKLVAREDRRPPIGVVDAGEIEDINQTSGADKFPARTQSNKGTTIDRIEYADGSVWKPHAD